MTTTRRNLLSRLVRTGAFVGAALAVGLASAQSAKPIRLLVGFPPGGGTDSIANVIEDREGITFGERSYVPGSGNRVAAMPGGGYQRLY